jgi:FkbM family methyltransferase
LIEALLNLKRTFSTHPLTRDAQLKAWIRFLSWQLNSRIRDEVIFQWIEGQHLAIRRGMTGATGNVYLGLHEFCDMMVCLHFLRPGDLFFDLGANVGSYSVLAAGVCGANVWAFEPDPDSVTQLNRNIVINNLTTLAKVYECALGSAEADVPFTVGLDTMNKVSTTSSTPVRTVRQQRLDGFTDLPSRPIMIKIDVEGYEESVIEGATKTLENSWLKMIELETITPVISNVLSDNSFEPAYYDPFSRTLAREPVGPRSSNALYVRDWPFVSSRLTSAKAIEVLGHRI